MFSGGIDSTHALVNLLTKTNDIVLVHHIHMVNSEKRHRPEAKAARDIVTYCRENFRRFIYSESLIDRSRLKLAGFDVITIASEAGVVVNNFLFDTGRQVDRMMIGTNQEEEDDEARDLPGRLPHLKAALAAQCYPNPPPHYHFPEIKPKAQLVEELGAELTAMCWTCRRPIENDSQFKECGKCKTCKLMSDIRKK